METVFEDLSQAVRAPRKSAALPLVAVALIAVLGVAVGFGLVLDNATAGSHIRQIKVRYAPDPIGDMYPREI